MTRRPRLAILLGLVMTMGIAATWLPTTSRAWAYPEPTMAGRSWQLDFTPGSLQAIAFRTVDGNLRWYWYLPYKVVNNTGQEQLFIPDVTIANDQGQILPANTDLPAGLYDAIARQLRNSLAQSPVDVVGRILQGEDNAKESVIIWPAADQPVTNLSIFIAGLSGEVQTIQNPATGEPVTTRKTLMLDYTLPGEPATPQRQAVQLRNQRWVMR